MSALLKNSSREQVDAATNQVSRAALILQFGTSVLSMIEKGETLQEIQKSICAACESIIDNSISSIFLLDRGGNYFSDVISIGLPKYYTDAISGEWIGPMAGSCGTAAYKKTRVISTDIATDPLWVVHRQLALNSGLKSSWSTPIFCKGDVYGIINMYGRTTGSPTDFELLVVDYFVGLLHNALEKLSTEPLLGARGNMPIEDDILKSDVQFQNVIENISGVYWVNDGSKHKTLYVSPSYEKIWGRKCENLYIDSADFIKTIHPEDVEGISHEYKNLKNNVSVNFSCRIIRPDGSIRTVNAKIKLVEDVNGRLLEYGYAEDITDRVEIEKKNEYLLNRNQQILRNMLDGFLLADIDGKIIIANKAYANMVGYELEEVKTMNINDLEGSLSADEIKERIAMIIKEGALQFETKHTRKDGTLVDLEVSISVMEIEDKPMITAFMRDITDKKNDQEKLMKQFHQLEKYAFINSHEVRARVATMLGLMNLYKREYVSGDEKIMVIDHLYNETNKLDKTIRELSVLINDGRIMST